MRVHMLQNAQIALNFLKFKKIKLVNIRPDDVVDGNPKLTLGLIWTIILHYQVRFRQTFIIRYDSGEEERILKEFKISVLESIFGLLLFRG